MNATKRKFNALLQGMGTRSTNGSSTTEKNDVSHPAADAPGGTSRRNLFGATTSKDKDRSPEMRITTSPLVSRVRAAAPAPATATTTATTTTTTTTSAAVAELELLAKRRRTGTTSTLRDASGNAATMLSTNSVLRKGGISASRHATTTTTTTTTATTTTKTHSQQPPMPRYCPGDREQLLRRLATFQELTDWTPKPDRINEIEWARRGWACHGKERVRCTLCSRELVVRLGREEDAAEEDDHGSARGLSAGASPPLPEAAGEALVDRYVGLIAAAHEEDCLWSRKGCDDSLLRLPLGSPRQAVAALRQRYDELCARRDFLPYAFNLQLPVGLDVEAVLQTLPPDFFANADANADADAASAPSCNRVALALAVLGWQGLHNSRIGQVPNSASCHGCLRRLGLWMFKSKQVDLATATVLEPAPMDGLDPVREHRFFCPWKNGDVQRNQGARSGRIATATATATATANATSADSAATAAENAPGWAVLVQVLRNDAYLRSRGGGGGLKGHSASLSNTSAADATAMPTTPVRRSGAAATATPEGGGPLGDEADEDDEDDEAARVAKDKERWARLRRVKSLFDPKGAAGRKLKRSGTISQPGTPSRPGTSHTIRPESRADQG